MTKLATKTNLETLKSNLEGIAKLRNKHISFLAELYIPITDKLKKTGEIDTDGITDLFYDMHGNWICLSKRLSKMQEIMDSDDTLKDNEEALDMIKQAKEYDSTVYGLNEGISALMMAIESDKYSIAELYDMCMTIRAFASCYIRFL